MDPGKNANPLVLNPSDLPTRRRRSPSSTTKSADNTTSIFALARPSSLLDPFSSLSAFDDTDATSDNISSSEDETEEIDTQEIYDLISTMSDPEHPITLGSLAVVSLPDISITPTLPNSPQSTLRTVTVLVTPTIQHCSLATVIGLGVRVRLEESLPARFRVDVRIKEGTHSTADEVNKQLADKERVAAALWNPTLQSFVKKMLETCE